MFSLSRDCIDSNMFMAKLSIQLGLSQDEPFYQILSVLCAKIYIYKKPFASKDIGISSCSTPIHPHRLG